MVLPASAEVSEADRARVAACYEAEDWNCAFEGMMTWYETTDVIKDCLADTQHGCSYEMIAIMVSGIGAAEKASVVGRRDIAERALRVLAPMSEGGIESEGEIAFSALRYDACKAVGELACMAESAKLMRLAYVFEDDGDEVLTDMDWMLGEFGVQHPLDLALVMKEVAGMEKQE